MARVLKEFDFDAGRRLKPFGTNAFDKFLDGQIWIIDRADFVDLERANGIEGVYTTTQSVQVALINRARRLGFKVRTSRQEGGLVVQKISERK